MTKKEIFKRSKGLVKARCDVCNLTTEIMDIEDRHYNEGRSCGKRLGEICFKTSRKRARPLPSYYI